MVGVDQDILLFDHGPGAYHRMMETGVAATQVSHVFLSHLHYDHCADYVRLLLTRWDQAGTSIPELKLYGPVGTREFHERLFSRSGAFSPDLTARTENILSIDVFRARGGNPPRPWPQPEIVELGNGDTVEAQGWSVTAGTVVHAQPQLGCLGFRLEAGGRSFAYSGDSGPCESMAKLAKGVDVLVHMCHYISGTEFSKNFARTCMGHKELAALGAKAGVRNLVISHITEQMDVPGVRERILREMGEITSGNLIWGEDLMEVPLGDPSAQALL